MKAEIIQRCLEELQLITCSLLPNERLSFLEGSEFWGAALERDRLDSDSLDCPPSIGIRVDGANVWFSVTLSDKENVDESEPRVTVSVKGENISRVDQERWQAMVVEKLAEIGDSDFPAYQMVSLYLLPFLHDAVKQRSEHEMTQQMEYAQKPNEETFHVLFTSHHLKSATKRRLLQQWSASLSLEGFAKVGHPGVIYAQGEQSSVEEFVDNVKAMQWLALKVRFMEPVKESAVVGAQNWKEFQKVGEVVEEMRRIGREEYVVEMGIGSASAITNS